MAEGGYKIRNQNSIHFLTFTVVQWVDVFTRRCYSDVLLDSLRYCQKERGLIIHAWCVMSNHIHLIVRAELGDLSAVIRDFKKFSAKKITQDIERSTTESRRECMLDIFATAGSSNSRNSQYQFWIQDNHPVELISNRFMDQRRDYIHNNPVVAGIVESPEDYLYSSARDYAGHAGLLDVEFLE